MSKKRPAKTAKRRKEDSSYKLLLLVGLLATFVVLLVSWKDNIQTNAYYLMGGTDDNLVVLQNHRPVPTVKASLRPAVRK
ncbi:hypothetical protein M1116_02205 [Patescibacteria group bacterium]|nr:hypothetical protein [Patescibacteria group bacterium]